MRPHSLAAASSADQQPFTGATMTLSPLDPLRLASAKRAFTTRRTAWNSATHLLSGDVTPGVGDLALARVRRVGQHQRIQTTEGRQATLFTGDEVVVAYANRYAPEQWEALVPETLAPCHLAAAGGVIASVQVRHSSSKQPTALEPIGILARADGTRVNVRDAALVEPQPRQRPITVSVVGASMDSGKTTSAAALIRGFKRAGLRVGAAKVTGTGACADFMLFRDSGAHEVLDFVDAGLPTTYRMPLHELERAASTLVLELAQRGVDVIVLEVADGILQTETSALLDSPRFRTLVDSYIFAAGEAVSAIGGVQDLRRRGLDVRGVSGRLTASPLAAGEVRAAIDVPVFGIEALESAHMVTTFLCASEQGKAV